MCWTGCCCRRTRLRACRSRLRTTGRCCTNTVILSRLKLSGAIGSIVTQHLIPLIQLISCDGMVLGELVASITTLGLSIVVAVSSYTVLCGTRTWTCSGAVDCACHGGCWCHHTSLTASLLVASIGIRPQRRRSKLECTARCSTTMSATK